MKVKLMHFCTCEYHPNLTEYVLLLCRFNFHHSSRYCASFHFVFQRRLPCVDLLYRILPFNIPIPISIYRLPIINQFPSGGGMVTLYIPPLTHSNSTSFVNQPIPYG